MAPDLQDAERLFRHSAELARGEGRPQARDSVRTALESLAALDRAEQREDVAALRLTLGRLAEQLGDLELALTALRPVCAFWRGRAPEDDARVMAPMAYFASLLSQGGDPHAALRIQKRIVALKARKLPPDHPEMFDAESDLAATMYMVGDVAGAVAIQERLLQTCSRTLPEESPRLQRARSNLSVTLDRLGQSERARDLDERVFAVYARTLPEDDPRRLNAGLNLATSRKAAGDLRGALALEQDALDFVARKRWPADHPWVHQVKINLAVTKARLGEIEDAIRILEDEHARLSRTRREDDLILESTRWNLAAAYQTRGDPVRARVLYEQLMVQMEKSPDRGDDALPQLQKNLALVHAALGDFPGALALVEQALEGLTRTRSEDDLTLLQTRADLAAVRFSLGDVDGALAMHEVTVARLAAQLGEQHLDLLAQLGNLAQMKRFAGDSTGALALETKVLDGCRGMVPEGHPWLVTAQLNVAVTMMALGRIEEAQALLSAARQGGKATLGSRHADMRLVRNYLMTAGMRLGNAEGLAELVRELALVGLGSLQNHDLAAREVMSGANSDRDGLSDALSAVLGCGTLEPQPGLAPDSLLFAEGLRAVERWSRRLGDTVAAKDQDGRVRALRLELGEATDCVTSIARRPRSAANSAALGAAVLARDRLERRLRQTAVDLAGVDPTAWTCRDVAAKLAEGEAAVSFVRFDHATWEPGGRTQAAVAALILSRDGGVCAIRLGPAAEIRDLVLALRGRHEAASPRGESVLPASRNTDDSVLAQRLRRRVLDPVLARVPDVRTLYVSADETLGLAPLDCLPFEDGTPVGERVALPALVSLLDLMDSPHPPAGGGALVAFGGIDYDRRDGAPPGSEDAPSEAPRGATPLYRSLPATGPECAAVADLWRKALPSAPVVLRQGAQADKQALLALAPTARVLHLATHGFFAPELDAHTASRPAPSATELETALRPTRLSPMVLAGLALSGANLHAAGRHGIVTAEEMMALDLGRCALVVLSACGTSVGVERAGLGFASLRSALRAAGAHQVLASLWPVGDLTTKELMTDFYRRLWQERKPAARALWEAKLALRQRGASFRDWAGWTLVGR